LQELSEAIYEYEGRSTNIGDAIMGFLARPAHEVTLNGAASGPAMKERLVNKAIT
jgi:hypothetical protein